MTNRQRAHLHLIAAWAFPIALWLIATAWFGFDLGKYSDDWAISLRTPETDAYQWSASPFIRWDYFWRPLHLLAVYGLATTFWHHDWVNHLVSALCHLGVGLLIYRLLRQLAISAPAARLSLALFLTLPISIEAVLWPAALGSVVGVGWFLVIALMCVPRARGNADLSGAPRCKWFLKLAIMGFLTACWHEQPAACVLALPLLFLAGGDSLSPVLRRGIAATIAAGAGVILYIGLFVLTVPPGRRGGTNTLTGLNALADRLHRLTLMSWDLTLGPRARDTTRDAFDIGSAATRSGGMALIVCGVLLVAAAFFVVRCVREMTNARSSSAPSIPRRGWIILFGLATALASLAPIALVTWQPMHPRYLYALGMGLALALAAAIDPVFTSRPSRLPLIRIAVTSFVSLTALACACSCIGWQSQFRARFRSDANQLEQLKALVPNPPSGAVFVPLDLADARDRALRRHDPGVLGALTQPWSCWAYVQRGYRRSDITATHLRPGQKPPVAAAPSSLRYPRGLSDAWGRASPARSDAPWDRVIPFAIDPHGTVRLISIDEAKRRLGAAPATDD